MDHLAILQSSSGLLEKILTGQRKIESRWYHSRIAPWNRIKKGDVIYFKYSCKAVEARANVKEVLQFSNLTSLKVTDLWHKYSKEIGIDTQQEVDGCIQSTENKKYCILAFIENVQKIKPFAIDKHGYGNACAWITVDSISKIKKKHKIRTQ
jgi:ASC-1-like (ASCH) protein